jgi:hypothetical protein
MSKILSPFEATYTIAVWGFLARSAFFWTRSVRLHRFIVYRISRVPRLISWAAVAWQPFLSPQKTYLEAGPNLGFRFGVHSIPL